ncbi:hypothetical protein FKM82_000679 [Ascaphus truei]
MNNKNSLYRREIISKNAGGLKNFWEMKIEKQTADHQFEDARRTKSALSKLREEWSHMLECRINMLQSFHDEQRRQLYGAPNESFQPKANTAA